MPRTRSLLILAAIPLIWWARGRVTSQQNVSASDVQDAKALTLHVRSRIGDKEKGDNITERILKWDPHKTAIVVCDMWNVHWCQDATQRVAQLAPRMNEVISQARQNGVTIIHCPSGTMHHYKDHPARRLAQDAPKVETKVPLKGWCHLDPEREGNLPIDDSDGGCFCDPPCQRTINGKGWKAVKQPRQIDVLEIKPGDALTDSAEAYYVMQEQGIKNVIVMGVHTNMCVLGRPFSIRQLVYQGQNVVLMRDLTDSMYSPKMRPFVNHSDGTDLVIEHIEKHWCPTITSRDFVALPPFKFADAPAPSTQ